VIASPTTVKCWGVAPTIAGRSRGRGRARRTCLARAAVALLAIGLTWPASRTFGAQRTAAGESRPSLASGDGDQANGANDEVMRAVALYDGGDRAGARTALTRALGRGPDPEFRSLAETYLDLISVVEQSDRAWQTHALVSAGGGVDSNVAALPIADVDHPLSSTATDSGSSVSPFASVALTLGFGYQTTRKAFSQLEYSLLQIAYTDPAADGYSFQDHALEWLNEAWAGKRLRFRLPLRAGFSLTGLRSHMTLFQWTAGLQPEIAVREAEGALLRFAAAYTRRTSLDGAYAHLSGRRLEGLVTQEWTASGWSVALGARLRDEQVGEISGALGPVSGAGPCSSCDATYQTPFSYRGVAGTARVWGPARWVVRPAISAGLERRSYTNPNRVIALSSGAPPQDLVQWWRRDVRGNTSLSLTIGLSEHWALTTRYELTRNWSNVNGARSAGCAAGTAPCHPLDTGDLNYQRHVVALELEASWF